LSQHSIKLDVEHKQNIRRLAMQLGMTKKLERRKTTGLDHLSTNDEQQHPPMPLMAFEVSSSSIATIGSVKILK
jgi:hypothetical protein